VDSDDIFGELKSEEDIMSNGKGDEKDESESDSESESGSSFSLDPDFLDSVLDVDDTSFFPTLEKIFNRKDDRFPEHMDVFSVLLLIWSIRTNDMARMFRITSFFLFFFCFFFFLFCLCSFFVFFCQDSVPSCFFFFFLYYS